MDKKQLDEVFQGIVDDKYNNVVGKIVEKDGKYVFEGFALNKRGKVIASITYVTGVLGIIYAGAKIGSKISEKILNKINQRKMIKAKAQAFDETIELMKKAHEELVEKYPHLEDGKHFKDEESE